MKTIADYNQQAIDFLAATETTISMRFLKNGLHFAGDKEKRDIYEVTLTNGSRSYLFNFGQSINNSHPNRKKPSEYDILTCLTKHDPGTFEDFCGEFGYDTDSRKAETIYKAVVEEFLNVERLFTSDEIEKLQEIQ